MEILFDHICRFNSFKSDINTRHQFQSYGIWLEFSRFSIDAQWMYLLHYHRCTLLVVVARKNALEDVSAVIFFSIKQLHGWQTYNRQ